MNEKDKRAKIVASLRLLARQWDPKRKARKDSRVDVCVGKFKNGNDKYVAKYKCAHCEELFDAKETHMDHIDPVVDPKFGFIDYNTFIDRLFLNQDGYQTLCKVCHKKKSKEENSRRTR